MLKLPGPNFTAAIIIIFQEVRTKALDMRGI
jgi:hypothetical protein